VEAGSRGSGYADLDDWRGDVGEGFLTLENRPDRLGFGSWKDEYRYLI
jgi:hypothetical protein